MDTLLLPVDAVTDVPAGMIAAVVTHLEMRRAPEGAPAPAPPGVVVTRLCGGDLDRYLALYRAIGERWLWFSRLALDRAALAAILDDPGVSACAVTRAGADIGLVELDARAGAETELAFFGLVESAIGHGLGGALLRHAVALAFVRPIERLTVHTCTFDHPRALDVYRKAGFTPIRRAIELARDPRLTGLVACEAAPHVPMFR